MKLSSSPLLILLSFVCCAVQVLVLVHAQQQPTLTSLRYYNDVRQQAKKVTRKGNVDVVQINLNDDIAISYTDVGRDDVGFKELAFCHLPTLIPLTQVVKDEENEGNTSRLVLKNFFTDIAGIALATQHLNSGNGTIVPEVEGINKRCNVRFTYEISDTEDSVKGAVDDIIHFIHEDGDEDGINYQKPCAFIGPYMSSSTVPASTISSIYKYPMFSPIATSSLLNNKIKFDYFGRLIPSDDQTTEALVQFLLDRNIYYVAVLHVNDVYGDFYVNGLRNAATKLAPGKMTMKSVSIPVIRETDQGVARENIELQIKEIVDTSFNYIIGVFYEAHYGTVMEEAFRQGIAGDGVHNWFFSDLLMDSQIMYSTYEKGSPLYLATKGVGIISSSSQYAPYYKKYLAVLQELNNDEDLDYLESTLPLNYNDDWVFPMDEFDVSEPGTGSPRLYDTVIAYGLAACKATDNNSNNKNNANNEYFTGTELFNKMLQTDFEGVSGKVKLDQETGTRTISTAVFIITNLVVNENRKGDVVATFSPQVTHVFQDSKWTNTEYQYIFSDGTTESPSSLPVVATVDDYLSLALKRLCTSMGVLIMIASIGLGIWTHMNRNHRVIRASQPIFLNFLLVGTFLMGSSIIPLTIDDYQTSVRGCVIACTIYPWLFMNGLSLAFTALLTKTKRINRILNQPNHFNKITVTACDVLPTMMFFVFANIFILSLWTGLRPMGWVRVAIDVDTYGRITETSGGCSYDGGMPYIISLIFVNLGALFYAIYEAYRARKLSTSFQESDYIMKALFSMMLVCVVGLPILIMTEENDARLYLSVGIIFVACMSLIGFIFVPKIWFRYKKQSDTTTTTGHVHIAPYMATVSSRGVSVNEDNNHDTENNVGMLVVHRGCKPPLRYSHSDMETLEEVLQSEVSWNMLTNIVDENNNLVERNKKQESLLKFRESQLLSIRSEGSSFIHFMEGQDTSESCPFPYTATNNEGIDGARNNNNLVGKTQKQGQSQGNLLKFQESELLPIFSKGSCIPINEEYDALAMSNKSASFCVTSTNNEDTNRTLMMSDDVDSERTIASVFDDEQCVDKKKEKRN